MILSDLISTKIANKLIADSVIKRFISYITSGLFMLNLQGILYKAGADAHHLNIF
jgi:hypothetical protein